MAEYVNEDKSIIIKNETDSDFNVGVGIVFRKSGIYEISINDKTTTVTKVMDKDQENRGGVMKDNKAIRMYDHIRSSVDVDPWAMDILQEVLEAYLADGCQGCIYEDVNEWEMPCKKCKRNCKDYWRMETHHG